ncbi:hypothetical protein NOCARDAX2BIS_350019 [Nocardioides sp. AX2bis]|nr:hypothetical protein NOCARDAX2BIS_350019 [Nocardioides sp. AX2bis]
MPRSAHVHHSFIRAPGPTRAEGPRPGGPWQGRHRAAARWSRLGPRRRAPLPTRRQDPHDRPPPRLHQHGRRHLRDPARRLQPGLRPARPRLGVGPGGVPRAAPGQRRQGPRRRLRPRARRGRRRRRRARHEVRAVPGRAGRGRHRPARRRRRDDPPGPGGRHQGRPGHHHLPRQHRRPRPRAGRPRRPVRAGPRRRRDPGRDLQAGPGRLPLRPGAARRGAGRLCCDRGQRRRHPGRERRRGPLGGLPQREHRRPRLLGGRREARAAHAGRPPGVPRRLLSVAAPYAPDSTTP